MMDDCTRSFLSVEIYFDKKTWNALSDYEKKIYSNSKRNYDIMCQMGLNPQKPSFMLSTPGSQLKDSKSNVEKYEQKSTDESDESYNVESDESSSDEPGDSYCDESDTSDTDESDESITNESNKSAVQKTPEKRSLKLNVKIPKETQRSTEKESTQSYSRSINIDPRSNKHKDVLGDLIPRTEKHLQNLIHLKALLEKYIEIESSNTVTHKTVANKS